jgi:hypothetical protein
MLPWRDRPVSFIPSIATARQSIGLLAALAMAGIAFNVRADGPQIIYLNEYATAQAQAKQTGLPIMLVGGKADEQSTRALAQVHVVAQSKCFLSCRCLESSLLAKKYSLTGGEHAVFLDSRGTVLGRVGPTFSAEQLLEGMKAAAAKARSSLLAKLADSTATATARKTTIDSYMRLSGSVADFIPLLNHRLPAVKTAVTAAMKASNPELFALPLLDAMAAPDAVTRSACYAPAVAVTKGVGVPPLKFWQTAPENQRQAALEKWRADTIARLWPINKVVMDFTVANMGKQVGNGECAALASEAFKVANAQRMQHSGKTYIWGREVLPGETVLPGDVVQMEDCKFSKGGGTAHHTVLIWKVLGPGTYEILEQNYAGRRTVGSRTMDLNLLVEGSVVIYRPLPRLE